MADFCKQRRHCQEALWPGWEEGEGHLGGGGGAKDKSRCCAWVVLGAPSPKYQTVNSPKHPRGWPQTKKHRKKGDAGLQEAEPQVTQLWTPPQGTETAGHAGGPEALFPTLRPLCRENIPEPVFTKLSRGASSHEEGPLPPPSMRLELLCQDQQPQTRGTWEAPRPDLTGRV